MGIIAGISSAKVAGLIDIVRDETDARLPKAVRLALSAIADQIEALMRLINDLEREIVREAKRDGGMRRMATIPGVGAITAASIKALVPDPGGFKSGRRFAAWLGLTPGPVRADAKSSLEEYRRWVMRSFAPSLALGATSVLRHMRGNDKTPKWLNGLLKRRPYKVVAVALANKMARIIWALLTKGGTYRGLEAANSAASA